MAGGVRRRGGWSGDRQRVQPSRSAGVPGLLGVLKPLPRPWLCVGTTLQEAGAAIRRGQVVGAGWILGTVQAELSCPTDRRDARRTRKSLETPC